jgi:hypothetical protein
MFAGDRPPAQLSDRPAINRNLHVLAIFHRAQHLAYAVAQLALTLVHKRINQLWTKVTPIKR